MFELHPELGPDRHEVDRGERVAAELRKKSSPSPTSSDPAQRPTTGCSRSGTSSTATALAERSGSVERPVAAASSASRVAPPGANTAAAAVPRTGSGQCVAHVDDGSGTSWPSRNGRTSTWGGGRQKVQGEPDSDLGWHPLSVGRWWSVAATGRAAAALASDSSR